jgi:hypothetical protein
MDLLRFTLWKIAAAEYGHGHASEYHRNFAANKPLLSDRDKIYSGPVLRSPPLSDREPENESARRYLRFGRIGGVGLALQKWRAHHSPRPFGS